MPSSTIPQTVLGKIEFFEQRLPVWSANAAAIGVAPADLVDLSVRVGAARDAYEAAQASRNTARADTVTQTDAVGDMYGFGSDLVKTIRAFALKTDNPAVYAAAQIPPPAPPTPAGPPEQPTGLAASVLLPFGIGLSWQGSVSQGAYFGVWRRLGTETGFSFIKTTKARSFEDRSLPASITGVEYYIAAYREDFEANSSTLAVRFGPGGETSFSIAA